MIDWREAHWLRRPQGRPYDVVLQPEVLVARMQAVLDKYGNVGDDGTTDDTW